MNELRGWVGVLIGGPFILIGAFFMFVGSLIVKLIGGFE